MITEAVNINERNCDVYCGRGTRWGNYSRGSNLDELLENYERALEEKIESGEITADDLRSLYGKKLGCHCKPKRCHVDILVQYVDMAVGGFFD